MEHLPERSSSFRKSSDTVETLRKNCHCPRRTVPTTEKTLRKGNSEVPSYNVVYRRCNLYKRSPLVDIRKLASVLWTIFLVSNAFNGLTSARGFGLEIEPSQRLLDFSNENENDKYLNPTPLFDNAGNDDNFLRKDMHLFAVTGHLFNRSIIEELEAFDPDLISDGDVVTVHFPTSYIPDTEWMLYHESSGLLQGVPLPSHEGTNSIYVIITHVNKPSQSTLTLPCTVEVLPEEAALELREKYPYHPKLKIETSHTCSHHEPMAVAMVSIVAETKDPSYVDRLKCVQNLQRFFGITTEDLTFHPSPELMKRDRPVVSGPGNVPKLRTEPGDHDVSSILALSWPLGCGSDAIGDLPILNKLETSAFDGSLAQDIGFDVCEWQIVNRLHGFKQLHRMKRQVGSVPSSANIFYPPASKLARRENGNVRALPILENEEASATRRHGRTRVAANRIPATPIPNIPIMASRVVTAPLDRSAHIVPPSTPSIRLPDKFPVTDPMVKYNEPPMMLFGMENVRAIMDTYMEFRIPTDVFFDKEDGMTRNLKLEVLDAKTYEAVPDGQSWLMFDTEAQLLYGVPDDTAFEEREYVMIGRDSGGKSASITFNVFVEMKDKQKPLSHKFTFVFTEAPDLKSENDIYNSFGRKLSVALAKLENMPGELTMVKTGLSKEDQRYISWFDRSFNDKALCRSADVQDEANLMIGDEASTGRNRPAREFAAKFRPEYKLKYIKIDLLGPCLKHTTTTTISTTTTTTTTTPIITTLTYTESPAIEPPTIASTTPMFTTSSKATMTYTDKKLTITKSTIKPYLPPDPPRLGSPLPRIAGEVGKATEFILPTGTFVDPKYSESEILTRLQSDTPSWVALDPETRTLHLMPTREDFDTLDTFNATHRIWKAAIVAKNNDGAESQPISLEVVIYRGRQDAEKKANHIFNMKITNYDIMNFKATERLRLVRLIGDIFGDKDSSSIYFYPIEKGSILFSWHNSSLSYMDPCPYKKIAMIANTIYLGRKLQPTVKTKFQENNFTVGFLNLTRLGSCKMASKTSPKSTTTSGMDVAVAGAKGKSTTIIIIALVVVCLVILIIILVVKCRMGQAKREEKREKREREEAVITAGNPDNSDTPRIKKGVPIIFQDEISMEPNGGAHTSPSTPLVPRNNGDSRTPAVVEDDENIHEETPFTTPIARHPMTPPTPIMSDRPPPPYVKSR